MSNTRQPIYHGMERGQDGHPVWLRFGMLRLIIAFTCDTDDESVGNEEPSPKNVNRWECSKKLMKFMDTFRKLNRAANHVKLCNEVISHGVSQGIYQGGASNSGPGEPPYEAKMATESAAEDIRLHFDSLLFYLRMQADEFAKIIPHFYFPKNEVPAKRLFKEQRKWFKEHSGFDRTYAQILNEEFRYEEHPWCNTWGVDHIRDIVVHGDAEFLAASFYATLGWAVPAAIGAQKARPDRRPIVLVGDGAFQMTGTELGTTARGGEAVTTLTYHRPLQTYVRALAEAGLLIDALEEWPSLRQSQPGTRAQAENRARREIPMFLAIRTLNARG